MTNASELRLRPSESGLILIDVQERLLAAMGEPERAPALRRWTQLLEMAGRLRLPVVVSEQYPRGLGPTVPSLHEMLGRITPPPRVVEKLDFSAWANPEFAQVVASTGRRAWIVGGMETHVCVWQTARDLVAAGYQVHVPRDAVLSRTDEDRRTGLELARAAGAVVTSTETALFDLVGRAEGDTFRALSKLVR
jgi:nicotinamidase-related amidase